MGGGGGGRGQPGGGAGGVGVRPIKGVFRGCSGSVPGLFRVFTVVGC